MKTRTWHDVIAILVVSGCALLICSTVRADSHIDLTKIMQIESGGNQYAYNRSSGAIGLHQVTPICLADYNRVNNTHYSPNELFDPQVNSMVAYWYINERIPALFKHYGLPDTVDNRLRAYNSGIRAILKGYTPKETANYIRKYYWAR